MAIPVVVAMFYVPGDYARWFACALFSAAGVTDWLDGHMARRWAQQSELGRFLDPIADKALLSGAFVALWLAGSIEGWLAGVVLGRDALILLFAGGKILMRYKPFNDMEVVMGRGGQLFSFEAVFSPRGSDGKPQPPPVLLCPADSLRREDIPADALARAGGGDPDKAPPELVAVLGEKATCLAISPAGKVPVLRDSGLSDGELTMVESGAMVDYILDRYGEGRLRPPAGTAAAKLKAAMAAATRAIMVSSQRKRQTPPMPEDFSAPKGKACAATV